MSLRELMVNIGFNINESPLVDVNSQTDELVSGFVDVGDTGENALNDVGVSAEDTSSHLSDVGDTGQGALGDIENAASDTNTEMSELDNTSKGFFENIADNWGKITLGAGAAGTALEGFARSQGDVNATFDRTAIATGIASDELRDMAVEMSDATTNTDQQAEAMEMLVQRGIDTGEQFQEIIPHISNLGTATGQDLQPALESADRLLKPFGQNLNDVGDNVDQMSRIMMQTDIPLGSLERNLGRVPDELAGLEFGLDDAAAGIEVFRDRGFEGREAVREFRRAVDNSEGDMGEFLDIIGLTNDEWEEYQEKVEPVPGLTEDIAAANEDNMTIMETMQEHLSNLMVEYGAFAEFASMLAPVMLGLGPAIKGVSLAMQGLNTAFLTSPIGWIVLGIMALVGVVIWAYNEFEWFRDIVNNVWTSIVEVAQIAWSWLMDNIITPIVTAIVDFVSEKLDELQAFWNENSDRIIAIAESAWDFISGIVEAGMSFIQGIFEVVWPIITDIVGVAWEYIQMSVDNGIALVTGLIEAGMAILEGDWEGAWNAIKGIAEDIWHNIESFFSNINLFQIGKDIIQGLIDGIGFMAEAVRDTVTSIGSSIKDGFTSFFSIASPSRLMMDIGDDIGAGLQIGLDDSAIEVARSAQALAERGNPGAYTPEQSFGSTGSGRAVYNFSPQTTIHVSGDMTAEQEKQTERKWKRKMKEWYQEFNKEIEVRGV